MTEFIIENGVVIDDIESVVAGISNLSGKKILSAETIKKFILNEKNTRFYIDGKCSCRMQPERDSIYLWLDSGFTDRFGNPIMISLLNNYGTYTGHYYGTMNTLVVAIKNHFPRNMRDINRNFGTLKGKYNQKAADRTHRHIEDEQEYLLQLCNGNEENNVMAKLLKGVEIIATEEAEIQREQEAELAAEESAAEEEKKAMVYEMNFNEKEITVELLLETIDGMQEYIDELLGEIEKFNSEDRVRMAELEATNEKYKMALVQMRDYVQTESVAEEADEAERDVFCGHELLGRGGKILVLGATSLDMNTMNGIAKLYGFQKKDFEYETDYTKVVSYAGRIKNCERYSAVIFGAIPHKVAGLGDWNNIIEKCKQSANMPYAIDARNYAGDLKVTKESYKMALKGICDELRVGMAG